MSRTPVITGIGLVTPLGLTASQTWDALLAGRFIEDHAKVPLEFAGPLSRVSHLAIRAAKEAAGDADLSDAALVVGTSKGPVESWLAPPFRLSDVGHAARLGLATIAADLASGLFIGGPRLTLSAACASGLHALARGTMLIRSGEYRRVLVVATEASVHPMFIASFARLGVLPPAGIGCRPYDRSRAGFLMSEAAAAVLLEPTESDSSAGVIVERFALGADATHLTGMDPAGSTLHRLIASCINAESLDLIHGHGTGTPVNDEVELAALDDCVAGARTTVVSGAPTTTIPVYSHKAALGHSLGAAGLTSVVLNVMGHRTGFIPPNVRTGDPLPASRLSIPSKTSRRSVRRSLAVAAGFGGAMGAVTLRDY